jgi:ATP-dependent exoDNAse (exonuclease V) beta subunit (contains helicase and exonuclease domains)
MLHQQPSFKVYNASAGSGKTFNLVKAYLKIILTSSNIFAFQNILAVTFTNKAAAEMKERVLENLQAFAEGNQTDMSALILKETNLAPDILKTRSKVVLQTILQNYSAFAITTIDSFTHKIIKKFCLRFKFTIKF